MKNNLPSKQIFPSQTISNSKQIKQGWGIVICN
jgi:hypothetical protein